MSYIRAYVDGACRRTGSPDARGAIGIVIFRNDTLIGQYTRGLGYTNNNLAEAEAVIHCLLLCWASDLRDPLISSDSQMVVDMVNRAQICRSHDLQPLISSVWEIQRAGFRFRLQHLPRSDVGISKADKLANLMLDQIDREWADTPLKKPRRKQPKPTILPKGPSDREP